jgi:uncharacterized membrane protein
VSASPVALALGLAQFLPHFRARWPGLHRWSGRIYALAVLTGGLSGLAMALGIIAERPVAGLGFGVLALLWLAVTANGVRLAIAGRIVEHRRWMIRSYALTLAAVTLRLMLPVMMLAGGMEYVQTTVFVAWACWVPNLILAEAWLRREPLPGGAVAI